MNRNLLYTLITVVLAALATLLIVTSSRTTIRQESASFAISDTSIVTKIYLSDKNNREILLERQGNGTWGLNGKYTAQKESVDLLLKTMLNLAILEPVSEAAHNTVVRLLAANAVKVEIYQTVPRVRLFKRIQLFPHEKNTKTYYVGHVTQSNIGTYMLMEGSEKPFIIYMPGLRGFVQSRYRTIESDWRDHTIFAVRIPEIASVTVEFPSIPEQSYKVVHEGNHTFRMISLAEGREIASFDTIRILDFMTSFMNIRFEALVNEMDPLRKDTVLAAPPMHVITIALNNGTRQVVKTYRKPGFPGETDLDGNPVKYDRDRLYAVFNQDQDMALIQYFVFDRITRPIRYFYMNE